MKAPDKIYIAVYPNDDDTDTYLGDWYYGPNGRAQDNFEYIRKNALLEWLEGKMTTEGATEGIVGGYDMALKDVIDKINSL